MVKVAIGGSTGRMGTLLCEAVEQADDLSLGARTARITGSETCAPEDLSDTFDVLVDFSLPEAMQAHLEACLRLNKPMVIGITGLSHEQEALIEKASQTLPIVYASNTSVGMNVCFSLAAQAAASLKGFDVEIIEAHHRQKRDAPSGTALSLGKAVAGALERDLEKVAIYGREGDTGARDEQSIGFSTIRAGTLPGTHTVLFGGNGETLTITHQAQDRALFAEGALRAARWVAQKQQAGLYQMTDVLGL